MDIGLHNNYRPCNEHPVHRHWHETLQNYDYKSDNCDIQEAVTCSIVWWVISYRKISKFIFVFLNGIFYGRRRRGHHWRDYVGHAGFWSLHQSRGSLHHNRIQFKDTVRHVISLEKINISAKLILRITVKEIIWTCVQFNFKLNIQLNCIEPVQSSKRRM